jgi:hypothetical protein
VRAHVSGIAEKSASNSGERLKWSLFGSRRNSSTIASHSRRIPVHVEPVELREVGGVEARRERRVLLRDARGLVDGLAGRGATSGVYGAGAVRAAAGVAVVCMAVTPRSRLRTAS